MKTLENSLGEDSANGPAWPGKRSPALQPSFLHLVSAFELHELRVALAHEGLPTDFEAKLARLAEGDLTQRLVARTCRLFIALLLAAEAGAFHEASKADCERLLRVLAYVRKDDDAVADYKPLGFTDDQQEVRAAMTDFHTLLKSFKAWRLRQQVPVMWQCSQVPGSIACA